LEVKVDELVEWRRDFDLDMGTLVKGHPPREKQLRSDQLGRGRWRRSKLNLEVSPENALSVVGLLEMDQHLRVGSERSSDDLFGPPPYDCQ
jgi:hypothetical protein